MPLLDQKTEKLEKMIDLRGVAGQFGVTRRCVQGWIVSGHFPKPIRVGRRILRWPISEINQWVSEGCPQILKNEVEK